MNLLTKEPQYVWLPGETAPKDGRTILADFGLPIPTIACWNEKDEDWTVAAMEAEPDNSVGEAIHWNCYWTSASEPENSLLRWMGLRKTALRKKKNVGISD